MAKLDIVYLFMKSKPSPISRRNFVENSALALGLWSCHFPGWGQARKDAPCIGAANGPLIVNGCDFMDAGKPAILLDKGLKSTAVLGCLFRGSNAVQSGADVQLGLNTSH